MSPQWFVLRFLLWVTVRLENRFVSKGKQHFDCTALETWNHSQWLEEFKSTFYITFDLAMHKSENLSWPPGSLFNTRESATAVNTHRKWESFVAGLEWPGPWRNCAAGAAADQKCFRRVIYEVLGNLLQRGECYPKVWNSSCEVLFH